MLSNHSNLCYGCIIFLDSKARAASVSFVVSTNGKRFAVLSRKGKVGRAAV